MRKRMFVPLLFAIVMVVLALPVFAGETVYTNRDGVKAYEKADSNSMVIQTYNGGTKLEVDHYNANNPSWVAVVCSQADNYYAWVHISNLSYTVPSNYCHHNWSAWEVTREATCTTDGLRTRGCSICGIGQAEDIPRTGHDFTAWRTTEEATCTSQGERYRVCQTCGKQEVEVIDYKPHSWGDWRVVREATCTQTGERVRKCTVCWKEDRQTLDKAPHSYGNWQILEDSTCTKEGSKKRVCTICGHESTDVVEKKPHDFEWEVILDATDHSAGIRTNVCKVCGYTEEKVEFDPEGTLRRGARGEDVREIQQLLADQNYLNAGGADGIFGGGTEKAIISFQTDQGLAADGVAWPQTINRLHHEFGPWKTIKALTRTEAGERVRKCKDCNFEQHESISLAPVLERGKRGEDVRAAQQIITSIGFDAGTFDGIYGQKLDNAFDGYAKSKNLTFAQGKITPDLIDAMMNDYIATIPDDQWCGEGNVESPVNLALTLTSVVDPDEKDTDVVTYNWSVTNMGTEPCIFTSLLLEFGDDPDYKKDNFVMVLDGLELEANCGNSASGSFEASSEWGKGAMNFTALAVEEATGNKWISNTVDGSVAE